MTLLSVALLLSVLVLALLVAWLVLQLRQAQKEGFALAERGMELLKAASAEDAARAAGIRETNTVYARQLESELAKYKQKILDVAHPDNELVEVVDDTGATREIDFSKLESIGPDDILSFK